MFRRFLLFCLLVPALFPSGEVPNSSSLDFPELTVKVKDAKFFSGFLDLYSKNGSLYALIPEEFLGKEFFFFSSLSKGNYGGILSPEMMLEKEIFFFEKAERRLVLSRRDLFRHVEEDGPYGDAVQKAYPPSLVHSFPILAARDDSKAFLILLNPFIFSRGAGILPEWVLQFMGIEEVQTENSHVTRVRANPNSLEIEIQSTLNLESFAKSLRQANQFRLRFSLVRKKDSTYRRRRADDRIGYFTVGRKTFSNPELERSEHRFITRWNIAKAFPGDKPSIVEKPIVFYLDPTIPHKYREYVRAGVLEWNVAFEKIGFIGAVEARQVDSERDWDPLDIEKSTISWTANTDSFAIGPSRINPETGEILDADLIVSSGMVSFIEKEGDLIATQSEISWLEKLNFMRGREEEFVEKLEVELKESSRIVEKLGVCSYPLHLSSSKYLAWKSIETSFGVTGIETEIWKERFVGVYLKHIVMHEVGHALGLRHNFKASSIKPYDELLDFKLNRELQPSSSVMDYNGVFVAKEAQLQGKYLNDSLGLYDFLAIEYGYSSQAPQREQTALLKLAASLYEKGLAYGTDEDRWFSVDPMIAADDISDDLPRSTSDRLELFERILENLEGRILKEGDRYDSVRKILFRILNEHLFKTLQITRMIGGISTSRIHAFANASRLPFEPLSGEDHDAALSYLESRVFSENWLKVPPKILSMARGNPWGIGAGPPVSLGWIHRVLQMLSIYYVLDGSVLSRVSSFHEKNSSNAYSAIRILNRFEEFIFDPWKKGERLPDLAVAIFFIKHLGIGLQDDPRVPVRVKLKSMAILSNLSDRLERIASPPSTESKAFRIQVASTMDFGEDEEKLMAKVLLGKINQMLNRERLQN